MPARDQEAAARLRRAMTIARSAVGMDSWIAVAMAARISPTTLDNWLYGRTRPRMRELAKVADVLEVPVAELEAA